MERAAIITGFIGNTTQDVLPAKPIKGVLKATAESKSSKFQEVLSAAQLKGDEVEENPGESLAIDFSSIGLSVVGVIPCLPDNRLVSGCGVKIENITPEEKSITDKPPVLNLANSSKLNVGEVFVNTAANERILDALKQDNYQNVLTDITNKPEQVSLAPGKVIVPENSPDIKTQVLKLTAKTETDTKAELMDDPLTGNISSAVQKDFANIKQANQVFDIYAQKTDAKDFIIEAPINPMPNGEKLTPNSLPDKEAIQQTVKHISDAKIFTAIEKVTQSDVKLDSAFNKNAFQLVDKAEQSAPDTFSQIMQVSSNEKAVSAQPVIDSESLPPADTQHIIEQIVEQAKVQFKPKNSEMIIKLKPEHLGELTLKVVVENQNITATFHSNNAEVRSVIEASLNQLKQEMSNAGLKVNYVGVYAGLGDMFSNNQREQHPIIKTNSRKVILDELEETDIQAEQIKAVSENGVDYRI